MFMSFLMSYCHDLIILYVKKILNKSYACNISGDKLPFSSALYEIQNFLNESAPEFARAAYTANITLVIKFVANLIKLWDYCFFQRNTAISVKLLVRLFLYFMLNM